MIDNRTAQWFLQNQGLYSGSIDGDFGPASKKAMDAYLTSHKVNFAGWAYNRKRIAFEQTMFVAYRIDSGAIIVVDGIPGPLYQYCTELWQNYMRDAPTPEPLVRHQPTIWPRQSDVASFYGKMGENLVPLVTPYLLYGDYNRTIKVRQFNVHRKVHDSALRAMQGIYKEFGDANIRKLNLDIFSGCQNIRRIRGGVGYSMHSWGIAIDWDAAHNMLRMDHKTAALAKPKLKKFLDIWEDEGWISLGRERDYDWMHVQAARL